jgi:hypothetical protein
MKVPQMTTEEREKAKKDFAKLEADSAESVAGSVDTNIDTCTDDSECETFL